MANPYQVVWVKAKRWYVGYLHRRNLKRLSQLVEVHDRTKLHIFVQGVNPFIHTHLLLLQPKTYAEAVRAARVKSSVRREDTGSLLQALMKKMEKLETTMTPTNNYIQLNRANCDSQIETVLPNYEKETNFTSNDDRNTDRNYSSYDDFNEETNIFSYDNSSKTADFSGYDDFNTVTNFSRYDDLHEENMKVSMKKQIYKESQINGISENITIIKQIRKEVSINEENIKATQKKQICEEKLVNEENSEFNKQVTDNEKNTSEATVEQIHKDITDNIEEIDEKLKKQTHVAITDSKANTGDPIINQSYKAVDKADAKTQSNYDEKQNENAQDDYEEIRNEETYSKITGKATYMSFNVLHNIFAYIRFAVTWTFTLFILVYQKYRQQTLLNKCILQNDSDENCTNLSMFEIQWVVVRLCFTAGLEMSGKVTHSLY